MVIEALVAGALAGVAVAVLARGGRSAGDGVRRVTAVSSALDLATERLDGLRAWPANDGTDVVRTAGRPECRRAWNSTGGRGLPRRIEVAVTCGRAHIDLASEAFP